LRLFVVCNRFREAIEKSLQTFVRDLGIDERWSCGPSAVHDPVAISSHLIDLLDEFRILTLEHVKNGEDTPLLDVLNRLVQDLGHKWVIEPISLILHIRSRSIPEDRFKCRKENQYREIIQVIQAKARLRDDVLGFDSP
jgi:hypothetical protein